MLSSKGFDIAAAIGESNQCVVLGIPTSITSNFHGRQITVTHEVVFNLGWNSMCNSHLNLVIPVTICPCFGQGEQDGFNQASAPFLNLAHEGNSPSYGGPGNFPSVPVASEVAAEYTAVSDAIPEDWSASNVQVATAVALPDPQEAPLHPHGSNTRKF